MTARKCVTVVAGLTAILVAGAGSASAGEITGNGEPLDVKGASICAYSGQNDGFHTQDPDDTDRVQSFGQLVKAYGPLGGIPGMACNPNGGGE